MSPQVDGYTGLVPEEEHPSVWGDRAAVTAAAAAVRRCWDARSAEATLGPSTAAEGA